MSEVTIIGERPTVKGPYESKKSSGTWKYVTLGGATGVLMGAGLLYGGQMAAQALAKEEIPEDIVDEAQSEENVLKVAKTHDEMSFANAFDAARAEVGAGGVFHWHNGLYNTFTQAEWNSMSQQDKQDFAQLVKPEVDASHVSTPTDTDTYVVVVIDDTDTEKDVEVEPDVMIVDTNGNGVLDADDYLIDTSGHVARYGDLTHDHDPYNMPLDDGTDMAMKDDVSVDGDVIMGSGNFGGHFAVGLDTNTDGSMDVAIIDANDNAQLDYEDVLIDSQGNAAQYGDLVYASDPMRGALDNPDVAEDMPDYMNDALLDA